jgi:hypothetical protein
MSVAIAPAVALHTVAAVVDGLRLSDAQRTASRLRRRHLYTRSFGGLVDGSSANCASGAGSGPLAEQTRPARGALIPTHSRATPATNGSNRGVGSGSSERDGPSTTAPSRARDQ